MVYFLLRWARRKREGLQNRNVSLFAVIKSTALRKPLPVAVVKKQPGRISDTLTLRRMDTYSFLVATPRSGAQSLFSASETSRDIIDVPRVAGEGGEIVEEPRREGDGALHRRQPPPHPDTPDDPFTDTGAVSITTISPIPSAMLRSRVSLDYLDSPVHSDGNVSDSRSNASTYAEHGTETASLPGNSGFVISKSVEPSIIGSTATSGRASATTVHTANTATVPDELGYLSDGTISTLPPSYRTHRTNVPTLRNDACSTTPLGPPLPDAPPSAYSTKRRRRSNLYGTRHQSRGAESPVSLGKSGEISEPSTVEEETPGAQRMLEEGQSLGAEGEGLKPALRRKSLDGGVSLAGGPL
ncbi:hypothetical protein C8Q77DRAFT_1111653 [Trametes polyzona]|nr:hypothetical protein C8Q77DRAFT_1111653 [Trametes polyzona]